MSKEISMTKMLDPTWPEVFKNPDFKYDGSDSAKAKACSDGIVGWMLHNATKFPYPPENFNLGLSKIRTLLGCSTRLDALKHKAYELGLPNAKGIGCGTCTLKGMEHPNITKGHGCQGRECYTRDYVFHTTMPLDMDKE